MTKPWAKNRKEITRLYIREGRTLQEVKAIMKTMHGFDASIRSYRQWFDKWDVTKYNCKKRQQRRRMQHQCVKQEACEDGCSPELDSRLLPYAPGLPATTSQDQLASVHKPQEPVAQATAKSPKVEINKNYNNNLSPQTETSWYKIGTPRHWDPTKLNDRKRRKLPQQHIKQETYTGLQSPPLDARVPYSRPVDTTQGPEYFGYSTPRYTEPFIFNLSDKPAWPYHDGRVNPSWDLSPSSMEYDLSAGSDTTGIYEGGSAGIEFAAQSRNSTAADRGLNKM
ncbi:unnamed protein product [Clonostachys rosea]|uniref:Clr5 domain-containing protein n=1 Tax=Bionectria ochroleuca TaxID=29856 RepID=A0ABY6V322_BIOOC|nr:unnamed protein product [Clonostachys rosea]